MALDLDALSSFDDKIQTNNGEPLKIEISLIEEDPNQPRKIFNKEKLDKLADSIKIKGLLTPISVKEHPEKKGYFLINNGARRFKAHQLLGLKTINAFIMNSHDDYAQVADNLIRENFTPVELSNFIQKKIDQKEKKSDIAKKLGIPQSMISSYLAFIDMPDCIEYIYNEGQRSPKLIYDLTKAYEKYPEQIENWITSIENIDEITVSSTRKFIESLKNLSFPEDEIEVIETINEPKETTTNDEQESVKKTTKLKPVILVKYNQQDYILVNKKSDNSDTIFIKKFMDTGEELEVKANKCKLIGTSEM